MEASNENNNASSGPRWQPLPEGTCAVAICSFRGTTVIPPHGIDIDLGDVVFIVGELEGWYRGHAKSRRTLVGIFPANHVRHKRPPATAICPAASIASRGSSASHHVHSSCSTVSRVSATSASPDARERESEQREAKGEDPVGEEVVEVVREWDEHWKRIYAECGSSAYQFEVIRRGMLDLMDGRKALVTGTLTQDQLRELKLKLTRKIDWGNRRLGLDLVPRIGFERACPEALGAVELYNVHVRSVENADAMRGSGTLRKKRRPVRAAAARCLSYHLLLSVRDFSTALNDDCELYFSLYDGGRGAFITERFMVRFRRDGMSNFVDKLQCQGLTVFEDLGRGDLSKELFLVVQLVRLGRMFYSESGSAKKSAHVYKRPFAGGVLNIGDIVNPSVLRAEAPEPGEEGEAEGPPPSSFLEEDRELSFKLYSCDERDFFQLHELLVRRATGKVSPLSGGHSAPANSVVVTLKLLCGDLQHIRLENPVLFTSKAIISAASSLVITKKLGFPDVIMPGDVRNDFYLCLESGEFEKSGKSTGKNIEVTLLVLDMAAAEAERGPVLPASYIHISNGTGLVDEYQSVILYHANSPKWHETVRLSVPIERFPSTHVRLEYRHCSTKEKNEKKLFGFSYVRLMDEEGTTLKDGAHELFVYKCEDKAKLRDPRAYLALPSFNTNSPAPSSALAATSGGGAPVGASRDSLPSAKDAKEKEQRDKEAKERERRDSREPREMGNQLFPRSAKEVLNISTLLVSTKLTQNMELVSLLKWKAHPEKVRETLMSVAHLSGEEVVKFLQDVLDVLFAMFLSEEGESNDNSGNVFIVLVNIFAILEDPKFEAFKPVIDQYIANHFAAALVYKGLLSSIGHYARVLHTAPKLSFKQIQKCFETLEYTFKFVIQSHVLFTRASGGELNDSLAKDVHAVFQGLTDMMTPCDRCAATTAPALVCPGAANSEADHVPAKAAALYNLSRMYTQLLRVLPPLDITRLVVGLLGALPLRDSIQPLSPAKLTALHHLVQSPLFADSASRRLILPEICKHLRHHLGLREELKLCTDVLGDMLSFMYARWLEAPKSVHDDIEIVAVSTLEKLVQSVLVLERRSAIVGNLVACMVGLLQLMGTFHYNRLWDGYVERASLKELLGRVFYVFRDLVRQDVYPPEWLAMKLATDSVILRSLAELAQPLAVHFLAKCSFDPDLWSQYFALATTFLTQPGLQLERFREAKSDAVLGRYGDMRLRMGDQILAMWAELGDNKAAFLPDIVGPFLEITLVPQTHLRRATLPLFYDLLDVEHAASGHFHQVEAELIDRLDELVAAHKGDHAYRDLFNQILLGRLEEANPPWKAAGVSFVQAVTRLLERLLDYRSVLQGEENRDKRMATTVNLLDFYQAEVRRRERYLRYVYRLHDLHVSAENYVEAGFTLLLHSHMLRWTSGAEEGGGGLRLPAEYGYPAQTELERKEAISLQVIKYFDAGKLWEQGIPLAKELADIYESHLLDYAKLADLLRTQATFFDNILAQHRPEPEYFRVGFYGGGFPLFVRNKEFVYRGQEYERLAAFSQRLLAEWPSVEVLKQITPPDEGLLQSEGRFLQICSVKPRPNTPRQAAFANAGLQGRHIAEPIQSYYAVNNVSCFQFDRRLKKDGREGAGAEGDNEFKHMWIERTTLTTAAPLPGILRWFPVVARNVEELTPVRFAAEKMDDVNRTLAILVAQYAAEPGRNVNPLSMRLQGMLDAAVMGGLPKYRDAFFTPPFLEAADQKALAHVARLHAAILEQTDLLEQALALHGRLAPPGVQPLHKRLVECFAQMKSAVQTDFNVSPATKTKFGQAGGAKAAEGGARDSFRKTTSGSSIVYTPLPPVPRQGTYLRKPVSGRELNHVTASSLSLSNRSSTSSTGYGHLVGSICDDHQEQLNTPPASTVVPPPPPTRPLPPSSDDDEDFYAKPDESKVNQLLMQQPQPSDGLDGSTPSTAIGGATPPPIPNRATKRQLPPRAHSAVSASHSNASTLSMSSSNAAETPASKHSSAPGQSAPPTEYILMPPSRLRELSADAAANASAAASPPPSAFGAFSAVMNESYFVMDAAQTAASLLLGPPLPPKSVGQPSTASNAGAVYADGSTPPQLPRRVPKHDAYGYGTTGKAPLTPKNSHSGIPRSSTPPTPPPPTGGGPPTPTKTPPPVPPKPRSNSVNNLAGVVGGGLEDYELLPPTCATPTSPSYEERFEQTSNVLSVPVSVGNGAPGANGAVKMRATEGKAGHEGGGEAGHARVSSTSTGSNGSGDRERRKTNKEFYELPSKTNYANRAEARLEEQQQPPP